MSMGVTAPRRIRIDLLAFWRGTNALHRNGLRGSNLPTPPHTKTPRHQRPPHPKVKRDAHIMVHLHRNNFDAIVGECSHFIEHL